MSVTKISFLTLLSAIALGSAGQLQAATLVWDSFDTRVNGTVGLDNFSSTGNGSIKFTTNGAADKASVLFHTSPAAPLGALGDLNQVSAQFYHPSSNNTIPANGTLAVRLWTNPAGTQALVWEAAYNAPVPEDVWVNANLIGDDFWQRANGVNHDQINNLATLPAWAAGFTPVGTGATLSPTTPIYGVQVSFGSGISGDFVAYLDQLTIGFGGASPEVYTSAIPEPATFGLAGIAAIGMIAVRRRQRQA